VTNSKLKQWVETMKDRRGEVTKSKLRHWFEAIRDKREREIGCGKQSAKRLGRDHKRQQRKRELGRDTQFA